MNQITFTITADRAVINRMDQVLREAFERAEIDHRSNQQLVQRWQRLMRERGALQPIQQEFYEQDQRALDTATVDLDLLRSAHTAFLLGLDSAMKEVEADAVLADVPEEDAA